jgi:RNA recognition motif-containing protein
LFSTYGHIIDVVALKTPKMRGQAHVAFSSVSNAALALKSLQGFSVFGKPMVSLI